MKAQKINKTFSQLQRNQKYRMLILRESRRWMVRSIAAKYCVDISTVLEVIKEVKKEIKKKKWIEKKTLLKVVNRKVTQAHIDSFLSCFNSKIGKWVKTKQMQNHLRGDNVLEKISTATVIKIQKARMKRVHQRVDKV